MLSVSKLQAFWYKSITNTRPVQDQIPNNHFFTILIHRLIPVHYNIHPVPGRKRSLRGGDLLLSRVTHILDRDECHSHGLPEVYRRRLQVQAFACNSGHCDRQVTGRSNKGDALKARGVDGPSGAERLGTPWELEFLAKQERFLITCHER